MALVLSGSPAPSSPVHRGYLLRKTLSEKWVRYWCVIQGGCLYCYLTPDDHVSVDVTDLHGYSVTSHDTFLERHFVLHLKHKDYIPVYLSATYKQEMEEWKASLTSVLKDTQPTGRPDSHNQANEESSGKGGGGSQRSEDPALVVRQKLLAEVLRQTQELERKRSSRMATSNRQSPLTLGESGSNSSPTSPTSTAIFSIGAPSAAPTPTLTPTPNGQPTGEQICTLTRLRQRRLSAQIKLETLQRQIQTSNNGNSRKSIFSFGRKKNSNNSSPSSEDGSTPHSSDIVQQLKALSDHLSAIDRDLILSNGALIVDPKMAPDASLLSASADQLRRPHSSDRLLLSRSNSSRSRRSSNEIGDNRLILMGSGLGRTGSVVRSNSLKSSMQKLAHRTFAKAGWHRNKKSSQSDVSRDRVTSASSDVTARVGPDVIDLSYCLRRACSARDVILDHEGEGEGGDAFDGFLPPPSPFKTTPSPSTSSTPRSVGSVSSADGGRRHSSSGSLQCFHDDPKSSRQRTDPDAIAHIEAFEEMSRQILGETPT